MSTIRHSLISLTLLTALFGAAESHAAAIKTERQWAKHHPRRAEVNARLHNQRERIREEVKEGEMSRHKANELHEADRNIRQQERQMARRHGGHLTRPEQQKLNQEENDVSRAIGR